MNDRRRADAGPCADLTFHVALGGELAVCLGDDPTGTAEIRRQDSTGWKPLAGTKLAAVYRVLERVLDPCP